MLHLTNGDAAAHPLRATGVAGEVVSWLDVLHDGPVPAGLTLEGLSDVRARFIASCGWDTFESARAKFGARDAALRGARNVVLWFEHDLYDQLQLIQILATLADQPETTAEMICIGAFPGVEPFHGLGQLTAAQIGTLWPKRRRVTAAQLALGARAWKAFRSTEPTALQQLLAADLSALPFLEPALQRWGEEFPSAPGGLSRTERQIMDAVATGERTFADVFRANQAQEAAPFLGDAAFQLRLDALLRARHPLLTPEPFKLTPAGVRVRAGDVDARRFNGLDRWLGGVHLIQ